MTGAILVIEPDEAIRGLIEAALRRADRDVLPLEDGAVALAAMEREHFPCVVVGSPVRVDADGGPVLFLEYIERHCPEWRPCLIVLTTHVDSKPVLSLAARLRACAVVAKPFTPDDLLNVVDDCLAGRHKRTRWIGISETMIDADSQ